MPPTPSTKYRNGFPRVIFLVPFLGPFGSLWIPFGTILGSWRLLWMPSGTLWGHIVYMAGFGCDLKSILKPGVPNAKSFKKWSQGVLRRDPGKNREKVCNIGPNLRPWTLPNCVRGLPNRGFRNILKFYTLGVSKWCHLESVL